MEAATLRFGSTCSLNQKKAFQFSQELLKARLSFPPNHVIQKENLNSNKISAVRLSRVNWRIVKFRCSSLEPKDTSIVVNFGMGTRRKKLAIFVSGGGSNFRSIHEASIQGFVHGDVNLLVTDKPGCGGAEYARNNGIPVIVFPKSKSAPDGLSTEELPIILRYSGSTVHFVDEHYDTGRTLAQRVVPVLANDTPEELAARVNYS